MPSKDENKEEPKKKRPKGKEKKAFHQYSEEALANALVAIRDKSMGIREAARSFNVPRGTLQDRLHGRVKEGPRKMGPCTILSLEEEIKLSSWITELAKCGFPRKKDDLLNTVQQYVTTSNKKTPFTENRPGDRWYYKFLKRHPELSTREAEGLTKSRAIITEEYIRKWFTDLKAYLEKKNALDILEDPTRILNGDETSFSLCPKTGKVLAPKGWKNVYEVQKGGEKDTLTVMLVFTASGDIVAPMVVFPYCRPPKAVVESVPSGWLLGKSETGWMRSETFYEYIANGVHKWLSQQNTRRPVLLLVDGHKSHLTIEISEFCSSHDIILYALPPNTTHILQPADVSVFKPLKTFWKKTVRKWQSKPENVNMVLSKTHFSPLLAEILKNETLPESIKNGFRKCGLYPFNPNAVDYSRCIQNRLESLHSVQVDVDLTSSELSVTTSVLQKLKVKLQEKEIDVEKIICELNTIYTEQKTKAQPTDFELNQNAFLECISIEDKNINTIERDCNERVIVEDMEIDYEFPFPEFNFMNSPRSNEENDSTILENVPERNEVEYFKIPGREQNETHDVENEPSPSSQSQLEQKELENGKVINKKSKNNLIDENAREQEIQENKDVEYGNIEIDERLLYLSSQSQIKVKQKGSEEIDKLENKNEDKESEKDIKAINAQGQYNKIPGLQETKEVEDRIKKGPSLTSKNQVEQKENETPDNETATDKTSEEDLKVKNCDHDKTPKIQENEDVEENSEGRVSNLSSQNKAKQKESEKDLKIRQYQGQYDKIPENQVMVKENKEKGPNLNSHNTQVKQNEDDNIESETDVNEKAEVTESLKDEQMEKKDCLQVINDNRTENNFSKSTKIEEREVVKENLEDHFYWPTPIEKSVKKQAPRDENRTSAISSDLFRKCIRDKENMKKTKMEDIRKRKVERQRKRDEMVNRKRVFPSNRLGPRRPRKKFKNVESLASEDKVKEKCGECQEELDSDTEDENLKHVGCDKCSRWYHIQCTEFVGLCYEEVADTDFLCTFCT